MEFVEGKIQSHACPACGTLNSGSEFQVHRGLKCASCGTGYIPVKIESRAFAEKESPVLLIVILILAAAVLAVFLPVWVDLWLVPVLLLGGILFAVLRRK